MRLSDLPWPLFAALGVLTIASWWLAELMTPPPERPVAHQEHSIDYYADRFVRTEMKPDGNPKSQLSSVRMEHYADDQSSQLERPVMLFFNEGTPPWVVRSETGVFSGDGNTILLNGKAVLTRDAYGKTEALEVISKNVTVHMDKKFLESEEFTEIFNHSHYTSGTGMHTDFAEGMKVTLLSNVRGRYEF